MQCLSCSSDFSVRIRKSQTKTKRCKLPENENVASSIVKGEKGKDKEGIRGVVVKWWMVCGISRLITVWSQLLCGLVVSLCALLGFRELSSCCLLALVVCCTLNLSSLLKSVEASLAFHLITQTLVCTPPQHHKDIPSNNILVLPSNLVAQSANGAVFSARLQSQHAQSLGNHDSLDFVVWWWDTLENLESLQGGGSTGGLVGNHTTDGLVEDSWWGTEMERT